jgi:clusterin-associated protein 1
MENFRSPNFELVADILDWLLHRFDPNAHLDDDISTEAKRVMFLKSAVEKVVSKVGIRMNPRKLYQADGYAVKELLKLAEKLSEAQRSVTSAAAPDIGDETFTLNSKLHDLKSTRSLCSQIVENGASLHDLLMGEADCRKDREKAINFLDGISRNLGSNSEIEAIERAVGGVLGAHKSQLEQMKSMTEELQKDEKSLEGKIKKKRQELERQRKRLDQLTTVRPAFMDEYEQLEQELEKYYDQYVGRFRNLDYLEHELDRFNKDEEEKMEENKRALKKMQKRLRDEEWRMLRGEGEDDEEPKKGKPKKPKPQGDAGNGAQVFGSLAGGEDESSDEVSDGGSSDPQISIGGSDDEDPKVSLGGSVSADDILDESDDEDISEDDGGLGGPSGRGQMRMGPGPGGGSNHDF